MQVLVKKMSSLGILVVQMVVGAIIMVAAMIGLPAAIAIQDISIPL